MLYAIVALLVIVLDQWTKLYVSTNNNILPIPLIRDTVSLVYAENKGGAFNFLAESNATVLFIAAAGLIALLTIIALSTNLIKGGLGRWSMVFISAGGLSNAIDRLMGEGKVQDIIRLDFLERVKLFGLDGINFPIFNVADIFITVFCFLLILYIIFGGNKRAASRYADDDEDEDDADDDELEDDEDEDEEDDRPVRRGRQPRRAKSPVAEELPAKKSAGGYEEDYERYKARKAREPQPEPEPAPVVDPKDPFAEWEKANRKAAERRAEAVRAVAIEEPAPAPVEEAPAPKPEDFSLEDILAEFK